MFRGRVAVSVALAAAAMGLNLAAGAPPAFAATSVTTGPVTPAPDFAGANSTYTVPFTVATALPTGGTITLVAPSQTDFSASSSNYSIAVTNSHAATVASVAASSTSAGTNNQVVITLGTSTIAANDTVTVTAGRTTNPLKASKTYTMQESTSTDTTPATSSAYTIVASLPSSISVAQGSPQSAQVNTAYKKPLAATVEDAYGNPVTGASVTFTAPSSGASGTFDHPNCPGDAASTPAYACVVSTDTNGLAMAATFTANGTANSPSTTPYSVIATVPTGTGTATTNPNNFMLTNTAAPPPEVTGGGVTVTPSTAGNSNATYVVNLTTNSAVPSGDTITLDAPTGTTFPSSTCDPTGNAGCNPADYTVVYGAGSTPVPVTGVSVSPSQDVAITVGSSLTPGTAIPAKTPVKITIDGVANPPHASQAYSILEFDQVDTTPVGSNAYAITPGPAHSVAVVSGANQQAAINTAFAAPLVVVVKDALGNPVADPTPVTFTLAANPSTSPSGYFPGSNSQQTDLTDASGQATSSTITANGITGFWGAVASINSGAATANFPLGNVTIAASIRVAQGSPQSAQVNTAYNTALGAKVEDRFGNPVAGANVTFTAPSSGASGTFNHANCPGDTASTPAYACVVPTDANGLATAATFTANGTANSPSTTPYSVIATVPAGNGTATTDPNNFMLTNTTAPTPEVTGGAVTVTPSTEGHSNATYVVNLTTDSAIPNGDTITLVAPTGTTFPSASCDPTGTVGCSPADYAVASGASSTAVPVTGVSVSPNKKVVITVGSAVSPGTAIAAHTAVKITINGVTNPTLASKSYSIQESDQVDTTPVGSNTYAITPGAAHSIAAVSGANQQAAVNTDFAAPLVVVVKDAAGNPVAAGTPVAFTLAANPNSSPSGYFPGSTSQEAVPTDASGQATSSTITANGIVGSWSAVAAINSGNTTVAFALTNVASPGTTGGSPGAARMVAVQGSGQSAHLLTYFSKRLETKVVDSSGHPVAGQPVTFSTPGASHPTAIFVGRPFGAALSVTVLTAANGIATAPALLSWDLPGAFQATAATTINGAIQAVHFQLASTDGYWLAGSDGSIQTFGDAPFLGSMSGTKLVKPVVGLAAVPGGTGYWMVATDGGLFSFGPSAHFYGSMGGTPLNKPIVAIAPTPDGKGYYMVASDGGLFAFGDAHFHGSMGGQPLNEPIVGMTVTADGGGYWLVASDGGLFAFGDARFKGSMGGQPLNKPIVGMSATPDGQGYWLVASDGGIFAFGDAHFYGSTGAIKLIQPIVGMASPPSGLGYWFVAADGGVFNYGPQAHFFGSGSGVGEPVVAIAEG